MCYILRAWVLLAYPQTRSAKSDPSSKGYKIQRRRRYGQKPRVVDQRQNDASYTAIGTIHGLGTRIESAAGKSTNIELVVERTKIGGNGPIMASSLARLGARVTYVGALGHPNLHPVFADFARIAEVHSIAEPGHSDALEFKDGKIILGKLESLREIHWANIQERFGRERFIERFASSDLVGLVNWTMLPQMSAIWNSLLTEVCPKLSGPRRRIFFDLADPQKRTHDDIRSALALISRFQGHFDVILGLNEKEAYEIARRGYAKWRESFLVLWHRHGQMPSAHAVFPERFEDAEAQGRAVAGTPDKVRDFLMKSVRDAGLNYLLCRFAFGDITGDEALNSVDLFTAKVMPDLTAYDGGPSQ